MAKPVISLVCEPAFRYTWKSPSLRRSGRGTAYGCGTAAGFDPPEGARWPLMASVRLYVGEVTLISRVSAARGLRRRVRLYNARVVAVGGRAVTIRVTRLPERPREALSRRNCWQTSQK